jgi:hypothetical protein
MGNFHARFVRPLQRVFVEAKGGDLLPCRDSRPTAVGRGYVTSETADREVYVRRFQGQGR